MLGDSISRDALTTDILCQFHPQEEWEEKHKKMKEKANNALNEYNFSIITSNQVSLSEQLVLNLLKNT